MLSFVAMLSLLLSSGCGMTNVHQPKALDQAFGTSRARQVAGSSHDTGSQALDAQVTATFKNRYTVSSSRYFSVSDDVRWVALSKNVQNQMLESSVNRGHYDGEDPGILLVDFYPQQRGAFVLAMDRSSKQGRKLVGYFVLQQKCPS